MNKELKALLIEDNPGDSRIIQEVLREIPDNPFDLVWVDRLSLGLTQLENNHVHVVLLDLTLPDSEGLNSLERVQEKAPDLPIVVLTGLDDENLATKAVRVGAQDYLMKEQIDGPLLSRAMRYAIERKRLLAELGQNAEDLRQSANQYQTILNIAIDGFLIIDRNARFMDVNEAYLLMTGYSREELLSMSICDVDVDETPEETAVRFEDISRRGGARFEVRHRKKDGKILDLEVSANYLDMAGGLFYSFLRDITQRKRATHFDGALKRIDASISSTLSVAEIMETVIKESAKAIGAETASILLKENNHWVSTYACCLPSLTSGMRFSNSEAPHAVLAAQTKKPIVINDAHADNRVDPGIMRKYRFRSVLAVPLIVKQNVIGVLCFNYHSEPAGFDQAQIDFASKLAFSISLALENALLYEGERNIADTLQEALLTMPPEIPYLDFGYLYHSATEAAKVGGDFFDLFPLDEERVGIIIGDVSGQGIEAAKLTSLVKDTIRAYSVYENSPGAILQKSNTLVSKATIQAVFVTVFFGILNTKTGAFSYCNAGHPPPVLKKIDSIYELPITKSTALGVLNNGSFATKHETVGINDILFLYTDGVIEARRKKGLFGEERLIHIINSSDGIETTKLPQLVFDRVIEYTGGELSDDVALLSVSRKTKRENAVAA